jgi:hypothetical protein
MTSSLSRWQRLLGLDDVDAAQQLGLELAEFYRQRAGGASPQSALLACLIALYRPPMGLILATARTLVRQTVGLVQAE